MTQKIEICRAFRDPPRKRKRHRHANHERERGLNQIPERAARPIGVVHLACQPRPIGMRLQNAESEAVRDEGQHDEPAIGVETDQAFRARSAFRAGSRNSRSGGRCTRHDLKLYQF